MRSRIKLVLLFAVLFCQGCQNSSPTLSSIVAPALSSNVVSNFTEASLKVNPTLTDSFKGFFQDGSYGYKTDNGLMFMPPLFSATNPDPSGSPYAMHLFGTYIDYGNSTYPAFELECFPRSDGKYFDLSGFTGLTGIKFDWCTGPTDNSKQYFFCLVTARIAPQSIGGDGTCGTPGNVPCYNYLGNGLFGTGGNWIPMNLSFAGMGLQYSSAGTPTVTAADKTQILQLMWTNRSNNNGLTPPAGPPPQNYVCDMWLDDVEFY